VLLLALCCIAGLVLVPLGLPGLWVMVGGVLGYGALTGFRTIGVATIAIVLGLAFLGELLEWWVGFGLTERYGGSRRSGWGALVVALAGGGRGAPPADQRAGPPEVGHDEHVFAGGAAPTAVRWQNPYRRDQRAAAEGAKIFTAMNCDGCHGGAGAGWVGPSLADGRWRFGGADGEIFQSIFYGRPHGMPAYGGLLLAPDAVWT